MSINYITGSMQAGGGEQARQLLLQRGIQALQARAAYMPAETDKPVPQTFQSFIKEKGGPRTVSNIAQWMTRGSAIGVYNPSIINTITVLGRYEQVWKKDHPIQALMQYEWYRRVLEYWNIGDPEDDADHSE